MRKYTVYLSILIAFLCITRANAEYITAQSAKSAIEKCSAEFYKEVGEAVLVKSFFSSVRSQVEYMGLSCGLDNIKLTGNTSKDLEAIQSALKGAGLCEATISAIFCEAISSAFKSLEDSGTMVIPKSSFEPPLSLLGYEEGGIGISLDRDRIRNSSIIVKDVIPSMPAYDAGIRIGDRILMINAVPVKNLSNKAATDMIRGDIGTKINITYMPNGQRTRKTVSLERKWLSPGRKYVTGKMLENNILYIEISRIGLNMSTHIAEILKQNKAAKKVILDLRYCSGDLSYINEVTDIFLAKGTKAFSLNYKSNGKLETVPHTCAGNYTTNLPCTIIINERTGSAGIAAAAVIKSFKRARIVGTNSVWTNNPENITPLGDNHVYSINNLYYKLNNGEIITCGYTLKPDEEVAQELYKFMNNENEDTQLKEAIKIMK